MAQCLQKKRKLYSSRTTVKSSVQPRWSDLQTDVLESILKKLAVVDLIRLRAVCSSWNRAVRCYVSSPIFTPTKYQPPWLMFCSDDEPIGDNLRFFSSAEDKSYQVKTGFGENDGENDGVLVLGPSSSHAGWLMVLDQKRFNQLYLLNPFSGAQLQLASVQPLIASVEKFYPRVFLSSDPSYHCKHGGELSAVIMYGFHTHKIALWQQGDSTWTPVIDQLEDPSYDYRLSFNGQIYAYSRLTHTLDVWDLHGQKMQVYNIELSSFRADPPWLFPEYSKHLSYYLVESSGVILFIERILAVDESNPEFSRFTVGFNVFKLNLSSSGEGDQRRGWRTPVQSLSDRAILLGENRAVSVSTRDFPEFQQDSVYFVEVDEEGYKVRFCSLKQGKISTCPFANLKVDQRKAETALWYWVTPELKVC